MFYFAEVMGWVVVGTMAGLAIGDLAHPAVLWRRRRR